MTFETSPAIAFTAGEVQGALDRVAGEVADWVRDQGLGRLQIVSILEGARPFTRELVRRLGDLCPGLSVAVQEVRVKATRGTALLDERVLEGGLDPRRLGGGPVLVVDDLVDSGKTLRGLGEALMALGVREVRTAVLVRKFEDEGGPPDFCGLRLGWTRAGLAREGLKDRWLYGFGMDLNGEKRELDHIGWVGIKV